MSELSGSNIPILGQGDKPKRRVGGFSPGLLIRSLDAEATMEPADVRVTTVQMPDGSMQVQEQPVLGRANIVTAEDLVEMMRIMVVGEMGTFIAQVMEITKGIKVEWKNSTYLKEME